MRARAPRIGAPEVTVAENQEEYFPLTVAVVQGPAGMRSLVTRWTMSPEERKRIADGEDLYISQLNFGTPMTPMVVGLREVFCTNPEDC